MNINTDWHKQLNGEQQHAYFNKITTFLEKAYQEKNIYPAQENIFKALEYSSFENTKLVIVGQDPYHGPGQAHGMSFSVKKGVPIPPSLKNIYKELNNDLNIMPPDHGCLTSWASQGVLLLNSVLTVEHNKPHSHATIGWQYFTDKIIEVLNTEKDHIVFMLWGSQAQKKGAAIDTKKHLVLTAPHPSPLSAYRGYFGCKHFSKANAWLKQHKLMPINWQLSDKATQ
jgi:uracil-DNA glycosylase